jgi:NADH-quinone oxidoreductase subunit L
MFAVFLPLVGFTLGMLLKKRYAGIARHIILLCILASCLNSFFILLGSFPLHIVLMRWALGTNWEIFIDKQTSILMCTISFVSLFVHVYSLDYMKNDPNKISFLAQLSFFTFAMMFFLVSPNLLQLFASWELISFASYSMIGFWDHHKKAREASLKAFLVNRFSDIFVILGIALFYTRAGTFLFLQNISLPDTTLICMFFLVGVMARSAQIGFHVWLPDSIEAPVPASALIHATTIIMAGIILMLKLSFLFEQSPGVQSAARFIGVVTMLYGGFFAAIQTDIKKIIAYSTCSQLGLITMACGIGAYRAAFFHLITHAVFKVLLFLGAGSVIYAMSNEQNIHKMGNLYSKIPFTYVAMWIGFLNLIGIPFSSGYFSKEAIDFRFIDSYYFYAIIASVVMTTYYALRLIYFVFHAKNCASERIIAHIHESPLLMRFSLIFLSLASFGLALVHKTFTQDSFLTQNNLLLLTAPFLTFFMLFFKKDVFFKIKSFMINDFLSVSLSSFFLSLMSFLISIFQKSEHFFNKIFSEKIMQLFIFLAKQYKKTQNGSHVNYVFLTSFFLILIILFDLFAN